jgi:acid phosphatase family membrane protein YuiD
MTRLTTLSYNQTLLTVIAAWFIAQLLKIISGAVRDKRIDFRWFVATGGFPSAHAATVSALATSLGLTFGFDSPFFTLSALLAGVVITDAKGIRQAAGKQAEILNKIVEDLYQKRGLKIERLKEFLGHTSFEVFSGMALGILVAILLNP